MTQKTKTGISRLLEFGGRYRWMTVVACILSGLSSVLMLCPFLCIWLVLRNVLAALPDLSTVDVEAMTLYGWAALGLAVGGFLLYSLDTMTYFPALWTNTISPAGEKES